LVTAQQTVTTNNAVDDDVVISISLSSYLLNRAQWCNIRCDFTHRGQPVFAGKPVVIDPTISFQDSRKRILCHAANSGVPLVLSLYGVCSRNGFYLQKCQKCKDQDKVTTNRKRKRDTDEDWTEIDQENNLKLFQVLETGGHKIGDDGVLNVRFRALCCLGASRQFHKNHINPNSSVTPEMHKGCEGVLLTLVFEQVV